MTLSISLYAGQNALKQIREQGLSPQQVSVMAGASGGPKWFTLYGLDCYLFGEFFPASQQPIKTIGSSAGAWRMACFAQKDPVAAITRLAEHYSHETYSAKADAKEITEKGIIMLNHVLGTHGEMEITTNPRVQSHFIVAKAKGLNESEKPLVQSVGILSAALNNAVSRNRLQKHFERFIFFTQNENSTRSYFQFTDMPTQYIPATAEWGGSSPGESPQILIQIFPARIAKHIV